MTPESAAAQTMRRELEAAALLALQGQGFYAPVVVRATRLGDGLVEALVTVEVEGGGRDARLALIDTAHGPPVVSISLGWPLLSRGE